MKIIENPRDTTEELVEKSVANLYSALFRMRQSKEYSREYQTISSLIKMLSEDRRQLINKHGDEISDNIYTF